MSSFARSVAALALACVVLAPVGVHADISMPPPLRFHLGRVTVAAESTAPEADAARVIGAVRGALRDGIRGIERCASHVHGGFSWRDRTERHARVRVVWDSSSSPTETRILSSDFAHEIGTCIRNGLRGIAVAPATTGRVVLTLGFDRD
jgi:hypothetical protein